jgi:hypothetical protein
MALNDILSVMDYYKVGGTNIGKGLGIGVGHSQVYQQYSQGLPSGNLMCYTILPTYDDAAFNTGTATTYAPNTPTYIPLGTLTHPSGLENYLEIVEIGDEIGVKLDYPRPLTIGSNKAFTAIISGFDRLGQKSVMKITGEQGNYPRFGLEDGYVSTSLRALSIVTSVLFTNTGGDPSTVKIILDKIIEIPYLMGSQQGFSFIWGWMGKSSILELSSIPYVGNLTDSLTYRGGQLLGGNSDKFISGKSIYYPEIPTEQLPSSMTLESVGPRILWNLGNLTQFGTNEFPFDQETIYTMYFSTNNPYSTSVENAYLNNFLISEEEYILGLKNYSDENWTGWKG